jgi:hypothetical protein
MRLAASSVEALKACDAVSPESTVDTPCDTIDNLFLL